MKDLITYQRWYLSLASDKEQYAKTFNSLSFAMSSILKGKTFTSLVNVFLQYELPTLFLQQSKQCQAND